MARGVWAPAKPDEILSPERKQAITAACEKHTAEFLLRRFLPEIRPQTEMNYVIAIYGKWHGTTYRFIQRYHSPFADAVSPEFDAPFTRLEFVSRDCFNLSWFRHTGKWHMLHHSVTYDEAFRLLRADPLLHPV